MDILDPSLHVRLEKHRGINSHAVIDRKAEARRVVGAVERIGYEKI